MAGGQATGERAGSWTGGRATVGWSAGGRSSVGRSVGRAVGRSVGRAVGRPCLHKKKTKLSATAAAVGPGGRGGQAGKGTHTNTRQSPNILNIVLVTTRV